MGWEVGTVDKKEACFHFAGRGSDDDKVGKSTQQENGGKGSGVEKE